MPNVIGSQGFRPARYLNGAAWNGGANMYVVPAADATQINVGDAVKSLANGDANGVPAVTKALGTDTVRGVVIGVLLANPNNPSLVGTPLDSTVQNIPASKTKDYYVLVVDDPQVLFELQDDGAAALTATACNKNASFTVVNPTSPQQNSASVLATATIGTVATLNLKIVGLVQKPNNAFGVNANWLVKFNLHELAGATVAV